ncbi:MAG: hypothetical protein VR69_17340 [Peptococcaceae bacterium BRH_c4b]|nr:MAG: hypothetical protein VR69_17340 [Peptococcaceae bacterium BRH_c4b]
MKKTDSIKKEVGSLATSIRSRLVTPTEDLESRVAQTERGIKQLQKACIFLALGTVISLGGIIYMLIR